MSIPRTSGIYQILCVSTGKVYIGSTVNLRQRYGDHWGILRRGKHHNPALQNAWNAYGADAFAFTAIELVAPDRLIEREQYYLDTIRPYDRTIGYNYRRIAETSKGLRWNEESRHRFSEQLQGRHYGDSWREKIARALTGRKGPPRSAEARRKTAEAQRGNTHTKGIKHTPLAVEHMSAAAKERANRPEQRQAAADRAARPYIVTDPEGNSTLIRNLTIFCQEHNLSYGCMHNIALGKAKQHKGWKCHYP